MFVSVALFVIQISCQRLCHMEERRASSKNAAINRDFCHNKINDEEY